MGKIICQRRDFVKLNCIYLQTMSLFRADFLYAARILSCSRHPEKNSLTHPCSSELRLKNQRQRRDSKKDINFHFKHFSLKKLRTQTLFSKTKQYMLQTTLVATKYLPNVFSEYVQIFKYIEFIWRQRRDDFVSDATEYECTSEKVLA